MNATTYLLIGGGLASHQAAKIIRMKDADGSITLVTREPHPPYDRPPLSKEFLRGEKTNDEILYEPESYFGDNGIDLILGDPVVELDAQGKTVRLAGGSTHHFDKALLATGGEPVRLDVPGSDLPGVYYLRSLDDAEAIAVEAVPGKKAVVIGAGFIGMEVAASLTQRGVDVTVIEAIPQVWPRFLDETFALFIQDFCTQKGIHFYLGEAVTEVRADSGRMSVVTRSGVTAHCDFVCVGVGITPEVGLARGLQVTDGVVVNDRMQTSHPDIYAAGDVINYPDPVFGIRRRVEHWGHAEYSGQIAGINMAGGDKKYDLLSYVWSDVFDLHIEFAGDESEKDRTVVRGNMEDNTFTLLYFRNNILTAYFAVNTNSREYPKLQKLIRRRVDLGGKDAELQDPSFELKDLL